MLHTPADAPHVFAVTITAGCGPDEPHFTFDVTETESGKPNQRHYQLRRDEHNDYLDLMNAIARDFHTRAPLNRRPQPTPDFRAEYRTLLEENLSPRILYGYGDPAVLRAETSDDGVREAWYYLTATSNDAPDAFPIIRSRDLKHWQFRGLVFPCGHTPRWAIAGENVADFWAPEIHHVGGEFRVYFVARHKDTSELCVGMATASRPEGPFTAQNDPLLTGNCIDPHLLVISDSEMYLYWKEDKNGIWPDLLNEFVFRFPQFIRVLFNSQEDRKTASLIATLWPWTRGLRPMQRFFVQQVLIEAVTPRFASFQDRLRELQHSQQDRTIGRSLQDILDHLRTPIYAQLVSRDGKRLVGAPEKVIENDQPWEAHVIEGIWVVRRGPRYYMFYSGNDFSTAEYGIGVAVGESPLGPFRKQSRAFLRSTERWRAPGHPSFAVGPQGEPLLFFHAYKPGVAGYKEFRALLAVPVEFVNGDEVRIGGEFCRS